MYERKDEDKYNAVSITDLSSSLRIFLSDSKLDGVLGAIAQVVSESPAEKGAKQFEHLKEQLLKIGQDIECV